MSIRRYLPAALSFYLLAGFLPAVAQIPAPRTDSLHPGAAGQGAPGCSATEASSCAQAAAKITPIVMGESPLEENLRKLTDDIGGRVSGSPQKAQAPGIAGSPPSAAGGE